MILFNTVSAHVSSQQRADTFDVNTLWKKRFIFFIFGMSKETSGSRMRSQQNVPTHNERVLAEESERTFGTYKNIFCRFTKQTDQLFSF